MPSLLFVAALLATMALPAVAHALSACTAAQISSQDSVDCPSGSGPCNISKSFDIGNGCTLDFGTRAVTVLGSGKIDVLSNTAEIRAGSFLIAPGGRVEGRGNLVTPPRDRGGLLTITTTGAVNIQRSGSFKGVVDFSANIRGGTFSVVAGGSITVSGDIIANNLTPDGGNGVISLRSDGDVTSGTTSTIAAMGGDFSTGGFVDVNAPKGKVDLGTSINVNGGDGGVVDILSGGESIVRGINGTGGGDAGSGGCASVFAGTRVQMLGPVLLNGTGSPTLSGGGCGGFIDIEARFGDATVSSQMLAESGAPDGGGGGISIIARGSILTAAAAPLSVQGEGPQSCGGEISLESDLDVTANGNMNASGGFGGNLVDVIAGRHATLNARVDAQGRDAGGFGGFVTVIAGDRGQGNIAINNVVDVSGGGCGTLNGCGLGGFTEISGCNTTVASTASVLADGADGGDNLLVAREKLTVQGIVDATMGVGGTSNGTNTFQHPSRVAPTIVAANVTPAPVIQPLATCATAGQASCLVPCPTCGNGMIEFPETCDQSGNTANCDGCTTFCRIENCNDSNGCTSDSCDATLGCRNLAVADGVSCSDGNVCNGIEQCTGGLCRSPTPGLNCNDNNACTTDSCSPTLGCQNPASPVDTPCTDNNICTVGDKCNGAKVCVPGPNQCVTSTTVPGATTSTSTTSTTSRTSTTAASPTTTSTSSTSTTSRTSTTAAGPTTTSTSTTSTTSRTSTTAAGPTTTSTSTTTTSTSTTTTSTSTTTTSTSTTSTSAPLPTTTSTSTTSTSAPASSTTSTSVQGTTSTSATTPVPTTTSTSVRSTTTTSTSSTSTSSTSTSTPPPTTTSTTLPGGCVPADCSDGDACTTDVCQGGTCVHQRQGFDAVACELGKLTNPTNLCAPDPLDAKLAQALTIKGGTRARNFVGKAENNTKTGQKLLNRALKQLTGLTNRVTKANERRITASCRTTLLALIADLQGLVQGLTTP